MKMVTGLTIILFSTDFAQQKWEVAVDEYGLNFIQVWYDKERNYKIFYFHFRKVRC